MSAADEVIRSRSNPLVRRLRALKRRADDELCLIEGPALVEEALAAGLTVVEAAVSTRLGKSGRGRDLTDALAARGAPLRRVDDGVLASLSELEASPGVLALATRPRFDEERLYRAPALVVVAVGIQNPGNLGALLRTAEAAGATGAYLIEGTADPLSWKALRGSMGSAFRLPHLRGLTAREALSRLRRRGVRTLAAVPRGGTVYHRAEMRGPLALFLGAEGSGLPEELAREMDERVEVPVRPPVDSLNVNVAAGVLLFEAARQRAASTAPPLSR